MPEIQEQIQDYRWPDPLLPLLLTPVLSPVMCVSVSHFLVSVCQAFVYICVSLAQNEAHSGTGQPVR